MHLPPTQSTAPVMAVQGKSYLFPAANDDCRYLRRQAARLCDAFNQQPEDVSEQDRRKSWHAIVSPSDEDGSSEIPLVKSPIHIDNGINVDIHPSCFINRDCYIADKPESVVRIGKNTLVGMGVKILGVTHPTHWEERRGIVGPSLAGDVVIGRDCFIGAGAILLPGIIIGDGCVVGAGSVVTRSVPAYHIAAENPARILRRVAPDVAGAPGMPYEAQGNRRVVLRQESNRIPDDWGRIVEDHKELRQLHRV